MSERALKTLLVVCAGLFLVWLAVSFVPRGNGGAVEPSDALASFFDGVTPEAVSTVRFRGPGDASPVELERLGGEWRVNGFRADSANVARFWEAMAAAKVGELVGSNPANHSRLGVGADSAWTFDLDLEGGPRSLLVGKGGPRYGTTYARLPDEDEVHLLEGNLRSHLTRSLDDWRNKRVATVDTSAVWRVEVDGDGSAFAVERADSLWKMDGGGEADGAKVKGILGELARLDASGFVEPSDSLATVGGTLRALDQAGDTLVFLEMGTGDGDRWARVAGDPILYRVASWRAGRLLPKLEDVEGGG